MPGQNFLSDLEMDKYVDRGYWKNHVDKIVDDFLKNVPRAIF